METLTWFLRDAARVARTAVRTYFSPLTAIREIWMWTTHPRPDRPARRSAADVSWQRSFDHPERADERLLDLLDTLHSEHAQSAFELLWVTSASEKALARHVTEVLETIQPDLLASFTKRFATFDDAWVEVHRQRSTRRLEVLILSSAKRDHPLPDLSAMFKALASSSPAVEGHQLTLPLIFGTEFWRLARELEYRVDLTEVAPEASIDVIAKLVEANLWLLLSRVRPKAGV